MPNKDGTGNALDGIKRIGVVLVYFVLLYLTGNYIGYWWLMMLVGGIGASVLAKLFTSAAWKDTWLWAIIGAAAGFGFYLAL
jgi:hypothetical protein